MERKIASHVFQVQEHIERQQNELEIVRKFEELQARLKEAEEVLFFYSDGDGDCLWWPGVNARGVIQDHGKKAREYFEKWK